MSSSEKNYGIHLIDCHYVRDHVAASNMIIDEGEVAFIETNANPALPYLMEEMKKQKVSPDAVKYIIITHVHLDHAGGSGLLMEMCPNATLLCHPKAARHVIDPSRLIASARKVYGDEKYEKLYGEIKPVAEDRLRTLEDNESVTLGSRTLTFLHTRGHANHHFCIHDSKSNSVFSGDSFGLAYPSSGGRNLVYPSSSPTEYDGSLAIKTIQRILDLKPNRVYLTHFGIVDDVEKHGQSLIDDLHIYEAMRKRGVESEKSTEELKEEYEKELIALYQKRIREQNINMGDSASFMLPFDMNLNAQGLAFSVMRERELNQKRAGT